MRKNKSSLSANPAPETGKPDHGLVSQIGELLHREVVARAALTHQKGLL